MNQWLRKHLPGIVAGALTVAVVEWPKLGALMVPGIVFLLLLTVREVEELKAKLKAEGGEEKKK